MIKWWNGYSQLCILSFQLILVVFANCWFHLQIRSHAQKYFLKVQKNGTIAHVPPPRPKRKASHPYPQKAPKNGLSLIYYCHCDSFLYFINFLHNFLLFVNSLSSFSATARVYGLSFFSEPSCTWVSFVGWDFHACKCFNQWDHATRRWIQCSWTWRYS